MSDFYCTQCGSKNFPIWRKRGREREPGHLKKLFCIKCGKEQNFCEIKQFNQNYTLEDFWLEYNNNNFDSNGNRKLPFKIFKQKIQKELINNE